MFRTREMVIEIHMGWKNNEDKSGTEWEQNWNNCDLIRCYTMFRKRQLNMIEGGNAIANVSCKIKKSLDLI